MARRADVPSLVRTIKEETENLANSIDAGMLDNATTTLAKLTSTANELERVASTNGHVPAPAQPKNAEVPPHSLEAEEQVLGAMMLAPGAIKNAAVEVRADHFYSETHRLIFDAIITLDTSGSDVTTITVVDNLQRSGQIKKVTGGKKRVHEIAGLVLSSTNVAHYARIVRRHALERNLDHAYSATPRDPNAVAEAAAALTREEVAGDPRRALDGSEWLHAQPEGCPAVWGRGEHVLWAEGEPLMIYGPDGVGKTTLAQQVVLHMIGIRSDVLLDLPVARQERPVLYLACDRPRQARRSFFRMVPRENHADLAGRLLVWEGPLPFALHAQARALLDFALLHNAGCVVIDSLKDVAVELTKPEIALKVVQAFQWLMANGVELLILHHPRKDPAGAPAKAKVLEDVYGDRNFVAGMGSVISLWGKAGDPVVTLEHLKQPSAEIGPFNVMHDHSTGTTTPYESTTIAQILSTSPTPLTVPEIAIQFYGQAEPTKANLEKARRELRRLVKENIVIEMRDTQTGILAFAAT